MAELTRGQLLKNPEILGATTSGAKIIFYDGDETNTVTIKAPDTIPANFVLTLPDTDGNANEYLKTDGSGNLSWSTVASSFNGGTITSALVINSNTNATSTSTGALQVSGGAGIGQDLYVGGTIYGTISGSISTASNLTGGTTGQILYQTAPGATGFAGPGTNGQLLVSSGTGGPTYTNTGSIYVGRAVLADSATTSTSAAIAYSLATTSTTYVSRSVLADSATTSTSAAIAYSLATTATTYVSRSVLADTATTATSAGTAYSLATTSTTYVSRAVLADSATTSTSAAIAYSLATTSTTYVGRAVLADSATTATSAGTAYVLATTSTTYVSRAVLADSATVLQNARTINGISFNGSANITVSATTTNALTIGSGLSGTSFNGSTPVTIAIDSSVVTLTGAQTLTNKTLTSPIIGTDFGVIGSGVTGYTPFTNNVGYAVVDTNNYSMIYSHNLNSGSDASSDFVAYNNLADISSYFIDMGINSSNYSSVSYPIFSANSGYIFTGGGTGQGSELFLGTGSTSSDLTLFTGGTTVANKRLVIKSETGNVLIGSTTDDTTHKLQVTGTTKFNGNVTVDGAAYATAAITVATQLVTKQYVDSATSAGLHIHEPVRVETAGNLNATYANGGAAATITAITATSYLTITGHGITELHDMFVFTSTANGIVSGTPYYVSEIVDVNTLRFSLTHAGVTYTSFTNGTGLSIAGRSNSGVGATLTNAGTQTNLVVDDVTLFVNDRVLVYEQTNTFENGVYVVSNTGTVSTNWVLTRATDADKYGPTDTTQLGGGDYFYITEGTHAAGESYICTNSEPIVFGVDAVNFTLFNAAPTYTGISPINVSGQNISLTGTVDATHGGTGASTVAVGDLLYGSAADTWSKLPLGIAYKSLVVNASGTQLEWNALALNQSAAISGELGIVNGGTGAFTSATARTNLGLAIGSDIPSVAGSGATGTWNISILGNAATATTATSAGTAYATIGTHTAGTGLTGTSFNGSANQTWTLNTATLMATVVLAQTATTATSAATAYALATTATTYVGRAVLADSATTATNAGTAYNTIGTHTAGTGLTGTSFNGSANQTWTLNTATLMATTVLAQTATTATSAATAYALATTATTYVGRAVLADSATTATSAATAYSLATTSTTFVGRATTATNIAGGTANQIPYNTGAGATTFISAPSTANTYLQWSGSAYQWSAVSSSASGWSRKTANYTAVSGDKIVADSSGGTFTITLPATPALGNSVSITDGADWSTTGVTVARNGSTIEGGVDDVLLNAKGITVEFIFDGTTWHVTATLGARGASNIADTANVVYLTTSQTLTNKSITSRTVTIADATSVTFNADTTDVAVQTNTQATGTLTINAPTGTPVNGQKIMFRLQSTNVQTFSWNAIFQGSTDLSLATVSSGSSKYDYYGFIYNSTAAKWQYIAELKGF